MTRSNLIAWDVAAKIVDLSTMHPREAVRLIGRSIYAVESQELDAEVCEAPWSWEPMMIVGDNTADELDNADTYDWPTEV